MARDMSMRTFKRAVEKLRVEVNEAGNVILYMS